MPHPIISNRILRRSAPILIKLDDFTLDYQSRIAATGSSISKVALQAHDDFFKGCKSDGIWNLFYELGTFAGDNLSSALVKFKFPSGIQSNLANVNFVGSDYSEPMGIKGDGATKYLNTNFIPGVHLTSNNIHLSIYSREDSYSNCAELGSADSPESRFVLFSKYQGTAYFDCFSANQGAGRISGYNSSSQGFFIANRKDFNYQIIKDGSTIIASGNNTGGEIPSMQSIFIFAYNNGGGMFTPSDRAYSFYSIGLGLSSAQILLFNSRVQQLQQSLNRAV